MHFFKGVYGCIIHFFKGVFNDLPHFFKGVFSSFLHFFKGQIVVFECTKQNQYIPDHRFLSIIDNGLFFFSFFYELHTLLFHVNLLYLPAVFQKFFFVSQKRMIQRNAGNVFNFIVYEFEGFIALLFYIFPELLVFTQRLPR